MLNLVIAGLNFGVAVWLIDYSMFLVALNVAFGVINFGAGIKPPKTTNNA
tara:strand:+ start:55 stop:204 length:150 start_codon:yes stop_codon:yes gene_type:complete